MGSYRPEPRPVGRPSQGEPPFVAEIDGEVVSYADVQPDGYIDQFFVSGIHGRQGIGRRLMERIHEEAMSLGVTALTSG